MLSCIFLLLFTCSGYFTKVTKKLHKKLVSASSLRITGKSKKKSNFLQKTNEIF